MRRANESPFTVVHDKIPCLFLFHGSSVVANAPGTAGAHRPSCSADPKLLGWIMKPSYSNIVF